MRLPAAWLIALGLLAGACPARAQETDALSKEDLLTWPRTPADVFGCFLEKQFKHKDPKFNCALQEYENKGDPCVKSKEYYEGPAFPEDKAAALHPALRSVDLAWEHGKLQAATFVLRERLPAKKVRYIFDLPKVSAMPRSNVLSYEIRGCGKASQCLLLLGFEHVGASETGCKHTPAGGRPRVGGPTRVELGEPEPIEDDAETLPRWAVKRFAQDLGKTYIRYDRIEPPELLGDFDGDGQKDAAFLVRSKLDSAVGVVILHASGGQHLLGGGKRFEELGPDWDWLDSWKRHPRKKPLPVPGNEPPKLKGDAIIVKGGPAGTEGLVLYFNGKRWRGYQPEPEPEVEPEPESAPAASAVPEDVPSAEAEARPQPQPEAAPQPAPRSRTGSRPPFQSRPRSAPQAGTQPEPAPKSAPLSAPAAADVSKGVPPAVGAPEPGSPPQPGPLPQPEPGSPPQPGPLNQP